MHNSCHGTGNIELRRSDSLAWGCCCHSDQKETELWCTQPCEVEFLFLMKKQIQELCPKLGHYLAFMSLCLSVLSKEMEKGTSFISVVLQILLISLIPSSIKYSLSGDGWFKHFWNPWFQISLQHHRCGYRTRRKNWHN